ncbi:MAG: T9SS type A sorting domain-containing protein [Bacteroidales bacterium]|nr:T9SS type A sorting domain-containing protein [Bacteroidales bacterium]
MMKKVLTIAMGLMLSVGAMAQYENPVVPQSDIQFWTGTGSNRAVIAVTWNDATAGNIGIAWGVQWNGSNVSIADLMDTIAAYDANLTIEHGTTTYTIVNNLSYANADLGLNLVGTAGWWWYNWKAADGTSNQSMGASSDILVNGDFVDWMPMDEETYESYPADTMIMAPAPVVEPQPEEATIAASDILYWVGNGSNQAIMAVNWADTALAWGYKYDSTKTVSDMMTDIAAADPRFSFTLSGGFLDDILFVVAPGDTLRKQAFSYWESKNNGVSDAGMAQTLTNGSFEKWAEPAAGVVVDSSYYADYDMWYYIYVYPMAINPVSVPQVTGIEGVQTAVVSVYPNPASDMLTVSGVSGKAVLFDMRGSIIASFVVNGTETRIDLRNLANGVYMLRVADSVAKIVVRR